MAVFTKLKQNDFETILSHYSIGKFVAAEGIAEGVQNTNYKLQTDYDSYILTIYESSVKSEDLPFFMQLQQSLYLKDFPCPMPVKNNQGELIGKFKDKNFTIVSFLKGKWPKSLGNNEISEAGRILGELHKITAEMKLDRKNSFDKNFWLETYSKVKDKAENHFNDLKTSADEGFKAIYNWPENLPKGIIHADFFPDNVLFYQDKASGVIDFYMACSDILAYDLAITLNAWCFEKDHAFNITKAKILLNSYNKVRPLKEIELESLPLFCIGASLRFLSTRLYDFFNRDANAMVNVKDPKEYIEKLKFHLQVKSHSEYGL